MNVAVLTVDQRNSRTSDDRVPATLAALARLPTLRPFQRTAGDEFQGVLDDPAAAEALQHPALKPLLEQAAD